MADDENLVCSNWTESLVTVGIAECYNSGDTRGLSG
jgi:hypothetical protein